jgi:hypothetical protein
MLDDLCASVAKSNLYHYPSLRSVDSRVRHPLPLAAGLPKSVLKNRNSCDVADSGQLAGIFAFDFEIFS